MVPIPPPHASGIDHFDVAFQLVRDAPNETLVSVYTDAAKGFAQTEWIDRADQTLRALEGQLSARAVNTGNDDAYVDSLAMRIDQVEAWQRVAAVDERYLPTANGVTSDLIDRIEDLPDERERDAAEVLLQILAAQLDNPNLGENEARRTIDELYILDDDAIRAEALVRAAEMIAGRGDLRAMNPVVQQAIATVPVLGDSLLAVDLNVRLAVLSMQLGRERDVASLRDQAIQRAAEGLIVDDGANDAMTRIIEGLYAVDGSAETMNAILSNTSPQSARARSYAYAAVRGGAVSYDEAERLLDQIADDTTRGVTVAEYIRLRSAIDPTYDVSSATSRLLNEISLSGVEAGVRESILGDTALSFYLSDSPDQFERLRGLIAGVAEFNRILIYVADGLLEEDRPSAARSVLEDISEVPFAGIDSTTPPRLSIARLYTRLDEFNRGIVVSEELDDAALASFLVTIPPDFLPNPVAAGSLQRISRR